MKFASKAHQVLALAGNLSEKQSLGQLCWGWSMALRTHILLVLKSSFLQAVQADSAPPPLFAEVLRGAGDVDVGQVISTSREIYNAWSHTGRGICCNWVSSSSALFRWRWLIGKQSLWNKTHHFFDALSTLACGWGEMRIMSPDSFRIRFENIGLLAICCWTKILERMSLVLSYAIGDGSTMSQQGLGKSISTESLQWTGTSLAMWSVDQYPTHQNSFILYTFERGDPPVFFFHNSWTFF